MVLRRYGEGFARERVEDRRILCGFGDFVEGAAYCVGRSWSWSRGIGGIISCRRTTWVLCTASAFALAVLFLLAVEKIRQRVLMLLSGSTSRVEHASSFRSLRSCWTIFLSRRRLNVGHT